MTKADFWKRMWIPITKRLPKNEMDVFVLVWDYTWDIPVVMESYVAFATATAILAGDVVSPDRHFARWCYVYPPS